MTLLISSNGFITSEYETYDGDYILKKNATPVRYDYVNEENLNDITYYYSVCTNYAELKFEVNGKEETMVLQIMSKTYSRKSEATEWVLEKIMIMNSKL